MKAQVSDIGFWIELASIAPMVKNSLNFIKAELRYLTRYKKAPQREKKQSGNILILMCNSFEYFKGRIVIGKLEKSLG